MTFQETEKIELKSIVQEDIKKEILAFANCNGGTIYSDTAIRQMIKESDGDSFEEMRSINQALSFDALKQEFKTRKIPFAQAQMQTLHIQSADKLYTNLGLLLSDQCPYSIKVAVFEGNTQNIFKDRREFSGSIMQQLHDVYDYIDFHNQVHASFHKLLRIDNRDYPEVAVREALLNSLVHRDYSFHAATLISIYPHCMEFVTLGGLPTGLELADIKLGISVCRNPHLADVFYRLQLIEAYGTGIKKIMDSYFGKWKQPSIICSNNAFKIVLPNTNAEQIVKEDSVYYSVDSSSVAPSATLPSAEEQILQVLSAQKEITRKEVQELLEVSQSTAGRILKTMVNRGRIIKLGGSLTTRYKTNL